MLLHVLGGKVGGTEPIGRQTDHGDGSVLFQHLLQYADITHLMDIS
jgi:hypothetical protein